MIKKIFGGAGTGKTTWMLNQLEQELKEIPIERIAFVTHTVAAKVEAKERVIKQLGTVTDKQLLFFKTIHGICYNQLSLRKENVMQPKDYVEFGDDIGIQFSTNFTSDTDIDGLPVGYNLSQGNEILAVRQYAAANMKLVSEIPGEWPRWVSHKIMRRIIIGFKNFKQQHAKFDFVDMLEMYLESGEPLPIDVLFIDEAQDLSKLQWEVVHKFMEKAQRVYIAGDDDQSIYPFIGADPYGFLQHPYDETEILPITYRLHSNIWAFALSIISMVSRRQEKEITPRSTEGEIEYWNIDPLYLDIEHPGTTMIIARHNNQLNEISKDLKKRGVSFTHRGKSITETKHSQAVHSYFIMRQGKNIGLRKAANLLDIIGNKTGAKSLRDRARENPGMLINGVDLQEQFEFDWNLPWVTYIGNSTYDLQRNEIIRNILNNSGIDALANSPRIDLTTYHGSKGREADHVILFTDCYNKAWKSSQINPDGERRLSYVGVTRAREKLTIVLPQTDMYMRSLR